MWYYGTVENKSSGNEFVTQSKNKCKCRRVFFFMICIVFWTKTLPLLFSIPLLLFTLLTSIQCKYGEHNSTITAFTNTHLDLKQIESSFLLNFFSHTLTALRCEATPCSFPLGVPRVCSSYRTGRPSISMQNITRSFTFLSHYNQLIRPLCPTITS